MFYLFKNEISRERLNQSKTFFYKFVWYEEISYGANSFCSFRDRKNFKVKFTFLNGTIYLSS